MLISLLSYLWHLIDYITHREANNISKVSSDAELSEQTDIRTSESQQLAGSSTVVQNPQLTHDPVQSDMHKGRGRSRGRGSALVEFCRPGNRQVSHDAGRGRGVNSCSRPQDPKTLPPDTPNVKVVSLDSDLPKLNPAGIEDDADDQYIPAPLQFRASADTRLSDHSATASTAVFDLLYELETFWAANNSKSVSKRLRTYLQKSTSPFSDVLTLLRNCEDRKLQKTTTLTYFISNELVAMLKRGVLRPPESALDEELQYHAFSLATHQESKLFPPLFERLCYAYQLEKVNHIAIPFTRRLLEDKTNDRHLKDAVTVISCLGLHSQFDLETGLFIPLILADNWNSLESLVSNSPEQQEALVKLLEKYSDRNFSLGTLLDRTGIRVVKGALNHRAMKKSGMRLLKKYNISPDSCPILSRAQCLGFLRHLLQRHYHEGSLAYDNWLELSRSAIKKEFDRPNDSVVKGQVSSMEGRGSESGSLGYQSGPQLHDSEELVPDVPEGHSRDLVIEFINMLSSYNMKEANRWYRLCKLSAHEVLSDVSLYEETDNSLTESLPGELEDWGLEETVPTFYSIPLPVSQIHIVDDITSFRNSITEIVQHPAGRIGLDCEWRPSFTSGTKPRIALLQLATPSQVYLLDVIALQGFTQLNWSELVDGIFMNPRLTKLGYGFSEDMRNLRSAIPAFGDRQVVNLIDISILEAAVRKVRPQLTQASTEKGLSKAVFDFLGVGGLDKREQISDWERRPLRHSQVIYAATDAYCLLPIYTRLEEVAQEAGLRISTENTQHNDKTSKTMKKTATGKKRATKRKKQPVLPAPTAAATRMKGYTTGSIKFVVSNMLQGLGRQLRLLGFDVYIVGSDGITAESNRSLGVISSAYSSDDHDEAAAIARSQNRVILTAGRAYERLRALYPEPDRCFRIDTELPAQQQALAVVKTFNINITKKDIFSRCQTCNNSKYIIVDSPTMKTMYSRYVERQKSGGVYFEGTWSSCPISDSITESTISLSNGMPLLLDPVSPKILAKVDMFFCCALCGKVFWEGSHYERIHENFSHILTRAEPSGPEPQQQVDPADPLAMCRVVEPPPHFQSTPSRTEPSKNLRPPVTMPADAYDDDDSDDDGFSCG